MSESEAVGRSRRPVTIDSLASELHELGVRPGGTVIVHTSLSALGWVCGGAPAVIHALLRAVGAAGTIVMPAYSAQLSEPSHWMNPPVPPPWWPAIREALPAFDGRCTPTLRMGAVAELFRTWPQASRSDHPTSSVAALGSQARFIVTEHPLEDPMGERSPLARLYELDALVVLLGVGHDRNTSLHLAERRAFGSRQPTVRTGAPLLVDGRRRWVEYEEPLACSDDFGALGEAFEVRQGSVRRSGSIRVMSQRALVDFGVRWLTKIGDRPRFPG